MEAMLADGGEEPTLFLWACDRYPLPHPFRLPTTRRMDSTPEDRAADLHAAFGDPSIKAVITSIANPA